MLRQYGRQQPWAAVAHWLWERSGGGWRLFPGVGNEQHDFLPEQFKKGNHFYGATVSFESWLLADAYVSRSLFKFCDMITAATPQPELQDG